MAIALVTGQKASAQNTASATSLAVSFPGSVGAGHLIVVKATNDDPGTVSSVAMTGESFAQGVHLDSTAFNHETDGWYAKNTVGGQTQVTINYSTGVTGRSIGITEWSGADTANPLNQTASANDTGTASSAISSPDKTPAASGALIWGAASTNSSGTGAMTANSPYTLIESEFTCFSGSEDQIQGAAAAVHTDFNTTGAANWGVVMMAFLPASGGSAAPLQTSRQTRGPRVRFFMPQPALTSPPPLVPNPAPFLIPRETPGPRFLFRMPKAFPVVPGTVSATFVASAGSYSITGSVASLLVQRTLTLGTGTYAITGDAATLTVQRKLAVTGGTYTITGDTASLTLQRLMAGTAGAYSLSGDATGLSVARVISAVAGSYTLTGDAATLTFTPGGGGTPFTLSGDPGLYGLTGADATLIYQVAVVKGVGGRTLIKPNRQRKPRAKVVEQPVERGPEFSNTPFIFTPPKPQARTPVLPRPVPVREPEPIEITPEQSPEPDRSPLPRLPQRPGRVTRPTAPTWTDPDELADDEVEAIVVGLALADIF